VIQPGQARRGPQLQRFGLLPPGESGGPAKTGFRLAARDFSYLVQQQELALEAMQLGTVEARSGAVHQSQGFGQYAQAFLDLSAPAQGFG
jgi:hypothetical protein